MAWNAEEAMTAARATPALGTSIRAVALRGGDARLEAVAMAGRENDLDERGYRELLQMTTASKGMSEKAVTKAEGAWVEVYGLPGHPGLKDQVSELRENRHSVERELDKMSEATHRGFESLRTELRSVRDEIKKSVLERAVVALACVAIVAIAVMMWLQRSGPG
jgi:hypothetical protein